MEGHLRRRADAEEDVAADQDGDGLGGSADDAAYDTDDAAADEEVPTPKYIAETTERRDEAGQGSVVHKRDPGITRVRANVCVDLCKNWCSISLPRVIEALVTFGSQYREVSFEQ
jgi:hypothetical protein